MPFPRAEAVRLFGSYSAVLVSSCNLAGAPGCSICISKGSLEAAKHPRRQRRWGGMCCCEVQAQATGRNLPKLLELWGGNGRESGLFPDRQEEREKSVGLCCGALEHGKARTACKLLPWTQAGDGS